MPFDGIEYGRMPLIRPPQHHPGGRCVGDVLRRSLAASYAYLRNNSGFVAQICWAQHPRRRSTRVTTNDTTSPGIIASPQVYLPSWGTHLIGTLNYFLEEADGVSVALSVEVVSESTGTAVVQKHEPLRVEEQGRAFGSFRFVRLQSGAITAFVERTSPTSDTFNLIIRAGADNLEASGTPTVAMRPQLLTLFWAAIG